MVLKLDGAGQNGFEEDEITWFSNDSYTTYPIGTGLEGCEITWFSNMYHNIISIILGLEGYEITWYSNNRSE